MLAAGLAAGLGAGAAPESVPAHAQSIAVIAIQAALVLLCMCTRFPADRLDGALSGLEALLQGVNVAILVFLAISVARYAVRYPRSPQSHRDAAERLAGKWVGYSLPICSRIPRAGKLLVLSLIHI